MRMLSGTMNFGMSMCEELTAPVSGANLRETFSTEQVELLVFFPRGKATPRTPMYLFSQSAPIDTVHFDREYLFGYVPRCMTPWTHGAIL